jgi:uncharacterized protein YbcI
MRGLRGRLIRLLPFRGSHGSQEETDSEVVVSGHAEEGLRAGPLASAISNQVVRVMSDYTGRGPTMARTYIQDDLISVVVRDSLTKGERRLVADGKAEVVLGMRKEFQDAMRCDLVAGVEELTGREVIAFFSANHIEPDTALESFLLAPAGDNASSPDEAAACAEP